MNKVSPTHNTQSQPNQPDNSSVSIQHKPTIKTPRDYRFILNLLGGEVSTHDLRLSVGSSNIWGHCSDLKERGWDIRTTTKPFTDRDGKTIASGFYHLVDGQKPIALEVLQDYNDRLKEKQNKEMIKAKKQLKKGV